MRVGGLAAEARVLASEALALRSAAWARDVATEAPMLRAGSPAHRLHSQRCDDWWRQQQHRASAAHRREGSRGRQTDSFDLGHEPTHPPTYGATPLYVP